MMLRKYKQVNLANSYIVPINKFKQLLNNLEGKRSQSFEEKQRKYLRIAHRMHILAEAFGQRLNNINTSPPVWERQAWNRRQAPRRCP